MNSKYKTAKVPTTVDRIYMPIIDKRKKIIKCAVCGKVEVPSSYIVYTFNDKEFCSWKCKSKYRKAHPEERELSPSEIIVENENRRLERDKKRAKEKYEENKSGTDS